MLRRREVSCWEPQRCAPTLYLLLWACLCLFLPVSLSNEAMAGGNETSWVLVSSGFGLAASQQAGTAPTERIKQADEYWGTDIHVLLTVCGEDIAAQAKMAIKSLFMFAISPDYTYHLHLHMDPADKDFSTRPQFEKEILDLAGSCGNRFQVHFYDTTSTPIYALFKRCATQRLYTMQTLKDVKHAMYFDSDTIVLYPLHKLFAEFNHFPAYGVFGLVEETLHEKNAYHSSGRVPFYPPMGLNTGVMLVDLERYQELDLWKLYEGWATHRPSDVRSFHLADQDLLNYHLRLDPKLVRVLPCQYNYRVELRKRPPLGCPGLPWVLHGNRRVFAKERHYFYRRFYAKIAEAPLNGTVGSLVVGKEQAVLPYRGCAAGA